MDKKAAVLVIIVLMSMLFISGCISEESAQSTAKNGQKIGSMIATVGTGIKSAAGTTFGSISQAFSGK